MKNVDIESILTSFQKTRLENTYIVNKRIDEIYDKIPDIKEIDDTIADNSIKAAKARVMKRDVDLEAIKESNRELAERKKQILVSNGYPEDYLEPVYNCRCCKDSGYVEGRPCSCLNQRIIDELYKQSNIKCLLEKENFDTFSLDYYSREMDGVHPVSAFDNASKILDRTKKYVESFDTERPNILIYGETGLGKTFLSNCIAKALLDKGHTVLYLSSIDLFENILSEVIINKGLDKNVRAMYDYIYNCDLLIIDDLGTEFTNTFVESQLFEIINKRNDSRHATLISTNLSMRQLQERYTERIISRMVDGYLVFNFYGDNIRYAKRKKRIEDMITNN